MISIWTILDLRRRMSLASESQMPIAGDICSSLALDKDNRDSDADNHPKPRTARIRDHSRHNGRARQLVPIEMAQTDDRLLPGHTCSTRPRVQLQGIIDATRSRVVAVGAHHLSE